MNEPTYKKRVAELTTKFNEILKPLGFKVEESWSSKLLYCEWNVVYTNGFRNVIRLGEAVAVIRPNYGNESHTIIRDRDSGERIEKMIRSFEDSLSKLGIIMSDDVFSNQDSPSAK